MTSVTVPLSEEVEHQLRTRATAHGLLLEEFARTIREREAAEQCVVSSTEAWLAEWRAWTASQVLSLAVDRDSIHEGCGE